jgi:protein-S-isoprenylcysteine O-methyltransferase Ste14
MSTHRDQPGSSPAPAAKAPDPRRGRSDRRNPDNMLPARSRRPLMFERLFVRVVATCGVVAVGVAIAAIMVSSNSQGWLVGLVVSVVSVALAALLWSSRQL